MVFGIMTYRLLSDLNVLIEKKRRTYPLSLWGEPRSGERQYMDVLAGLFSVAGCVAKKGQG